MATSLQRRAADIYSPAIVGQLEAVEIASGGRDELIATLSCAPRSQDLDFLLNLVADPDKSRLSLADLCAAADLRPAELFTHLKAGNLNKAQALATRVYPQHLPSVVEDVFLRAQPHIIDCRACLGTGQSLEYSAEAGKRVEVPCQACRETGKETVQADITRVNVALKMTGMLSEGNQGTNIQVNTLLQGGGGGSGGGVLQAVQADAAASLRALEDTPLPTREEPMEGEVVEDA